MGRRGKEGRGDCVFSFPRLPHFTPGTQATKTKHSELENETIITRFNLVLGALGVGFQVLRLPYYW